MQNFNSRRLLLFCSILLFETIVIFAQEQKYIAIIPPFQDRMKATHAEGYLQLMSQNFTLFLYQDAVAVYSEAIFKNTGPDSLVQEIGLPSSDCSYISKEDKRLSNGILDVQLRIEEKKVQPNYLIDGDKEWYTVNLELEPGEYAKVKALFWAQTSLTDLDSIPGLDTLIIADGDRGFIVGLSEAAIWHGFIENMNVTIICKDGLAAKSKTFNADPDSYDLQDSVLTWDMNEIEPYSDDNISVLYLSSHRLKTAKNTMAKLSRFILTNVYDELLSYIANKQEN